MSSTENWSFFYDPLNRSRNEIRLVHIHAAPNHEAGISCSLRHVSLDDQPVYYALSYSWGSTQKTNTILLDGQAFTVTENLYEALRELRRLTRSIGVWIDQISLNQEDVVERNQEVLRMLDIYRGATHVVIWLGTASNHTADAINCLKKLQFDEKVKNSNKAADVALRWLIWGSYYVGLLVVLPFMAIVNTIRARDIIVCAWLATRTGLTGILFRIVSGGRSLQIPLWGLVARLINLFMYYVLFFHWWKMWGVYAGEHERKTRPTDATVEALKNFFARDWFCRIWIVQEISVAREATVLCGSHALEWEVVLEAVTRMGEEVWRSKSRHPYLDTNFEFASIIGTTYTKIRSAKDHETMNLLYVLSRFCYNKATVGHDKAYGLLGLCSEVQNQKGKEIALEPRYDKPIEYAFADVVRFSIESSQRLDILRACTGHRRSPHIPSWVPDWTIAERKDSGGGIKWEERYTLSDLPDSPSSIAEFSADLQSLHVRGVIIGHVTNIGEDSVMRNLKTAEMKNLPDVPFLPRFNIAYLTTLLALFARIGVIQWLCKLAARRFAALNPGSALEDCEEVVDILAAEFRDKWNPTGSSFWETMQGFWNVDVPMTTDVPRSAANMSDAEIWTRSCAWEAVPELGLLPLLPIIVPIDISADMPQPGDVICMMLGSSIPYVLRDKYGFYELIGSGEISLINRYVWRTVVKAYQAGNVELQEFTIR